MFTSFDEILGLYRTYIKDTCTSTATAIEQQKTSVTYELLFINVIGQMAMYLMAGHELKC